MENFFWGSWSTGVFFFGPLVRIIVAVGCAFSEISIRSFFIEEEVHCELVFCRFPFIGDALLAFRVEVIFEGFLLDWKPVPWGYIFLIVTS